MRTALAGSLLVAMALVLAGAGQRAPAATGSSEAQGGREPERPRATVDVGEVRQAGRTIRVPAGGNLQAALDEARPGDRILLEPRAVYRGPFRLPRKDGHDWIVVSTEAAAQLPEAGRRVDPSHARLMPRLVAAAGTVVSADAGAHHYRLVGLDIAPADGAVVRTLVTLGEGSEAEPSDLPHHIIIDRCYLHGDPRRATRRGVALNARHAAVVGSYLSNLKEVGADSQAIAGWNGPGPFRIANNFLEAAGENVMFGGADPAIRDLVPADIEIIGNHMAKPLAWRSGASGEAWTVKNLFELKNARRVVVDGNLFERNWAQAQNGFAILFTVRNQDGGAPWSVVEDVTFTNNLVRSAGGGINILGHDDNFPSRQTARLVIRNNVFADIGGVWGHGRLFQLLDGTRDVVIDHNTAFQTGSALFGGDGRPHTGFVFQNNLMLAQRGGILGSGTAEGTATLERYFPRAIVRRNLMVGANANIHPRDNFFPADLGEVGMVSGDPPERVVALASRFRGGATDGRDPGADMGTVTPGLQTAGWPAVPLSPAFFFWGALALLAYVCIGYPVVSRLRVAFRPQPTRRAPIEPGVSVLVAAHNEGGRIGARIENLLALDYPSNRLEILVGSDGSTDDTVQRALAVGGRVRVLAGPVRRGKPAVLNELVAGARGEIIVFADARQRFDPGALRALAANFADPAVGAVSGELVLQPPRAETGAATGAAFYWQYEKLVRHAESRGGSVVGATGAIYAIRRTLFEPLPEDTILDDVLIPLRIARRGYRVVFEPGARAYDAAAATAGQELVRKIRTIGGNFQLFARERWLLNPLTNPLWFETISHKALRLTLPLLLATAFVANLALLDRWPYRWTMAAQLAFYAAAVAGFLFRHAPRRPIVFTVPYTMCLLSWATLVGFARFVTHRQPVTWDRAEPSTLRS